jgi:hypothetical protein
MTTVQKNIRADKFTQWLTFAQRGCGVLIYRSCHFTAKWAAVFRLDENCIMGCVDGLYQNRDQWQRDAQQHGQPGWGKKPEECFVFQRGGPINNRMDQRGETPL